MEINGRYKKTGEALKRLHEAVARENLTDMERDGLIQRFEFSFEILWKCAKDYLRDYEGIDAASPKKVIRSSLSVGLLTPEETKLALDMANDRNLTAHTYDDILAADMVERIKKYSPLMEKWYKAILSSREGE